MIKGRLNRKQLKIKQILGLLSGDIKPIEISPRLELFFDSDGVTIISRLINGKQVDEKTMGEALENPSFDNFRTFGRKNDDEEYYY